MEVDRTRLSYLWLIIEKPQVDVSMEWNLEIVEGKAEYIEKKEIQGKRGNDC